MGLEVMRGRLLGGQAGLVAIDLGLIGSARLGLGRLGLVVGPSGATAQQQGGGEQQRGSAESAAGAGQEGLVRHRQIPGGCVGRCGSKVMHHFTATPYPKGHGAFAPLVGPPPFQLDET